MLVRLSLEEIDGYDLVLPVTQAGSLLGMLYVKLRPYLLPFLDFLASHFEVIVFCKGLPMYCAPVLDALESEKRYFAHRVYGNHTLFENQQFSVKYYDFLISAPRTVKNTIVVDSHVGAYCLNLANGLPATPFTGAALDSELVRLAKFLEGLQKADDVSQVIGSTLKRYTTRCPLMSWFKENNDEW